jgi:hypothetical protein
MHANSAYVQLGKATTIFASLMSNYAATLARTPTMSAAAFPL